MLISPLKKTASGKILLLNIFIVLIFFKITMNENYFAALQGGMMKPVGPEPAENGHQANRPGNRVEEE